ncbi:MAG: hypothetical protein QGG14_01475 [Planctomycetota bacterium]|jgi:hypothetical protein|nr:hypothetical protein [Planctomycetota bacterium]
MKKTMLTIEMLVVIKRALEDVHDLPLEPGDTSDKARRWVRQELARRRKGSKGQQETAKRCRIQNAHKTREATR